MEELKVGSTYFLSDNDEPDELQGEYILKSIDEDDKYIFKSKDKNSITTIYRNNFYNFNPDTGSVIAIKSDASKKEVFDQLKQSSLRKSEGDIPAYRPDTGSVIDIKSDISTNEVFDQLKQSSSRKAKGGKTKKSKGKKSKGTRKNRKH